MTCNRQKWGYFWGHEHFGLIPWYFSTPKSLLSKRHLADPGWLKCPKRFQIIWTNHWFQSCCEFRGKDIFCPKVFTAPSCGGCVFQSLQFHPKDAKSARGKWVDLALGLPATPIIVPKKTFSCHPGGDLLHNNFCPTHIFVFFPWESDFPLNPAAVILRTIFHSCYSNRFKLTLPWEGPWGFLGHWSAKTTLQAEPRGQEWSWMVFFETQEVSWL